MALIDPTTASVPASVATFTTTQRGFWLISSGFRPGEFATVWGKGPDDALRPVTNVAGQISVSYSPNTVFVDLPAGDYAVNKDETNEAASVDYKEEL